MLSLRGQRRSHLRGVEDAWGDAVDGDTVRPELGCERACHVGDARFRGVIGRLGGRADPVGIDGGDIDDLAGPARRHATAGFMVHEPGADEVYPHHLLELLPRRFVVRFAQHDAGCVHDDVDVAVGALHPVEEGTELSFVGDVADIGPSASAGKSDRRDLVLPPGELTYDEPGAPPREGPGTAGQWQPGGSATSAESRLR